MIAALAPAQAADEPRSTINKDDVLASRACVVAWRESRVTCDNAAPAGACACGAAALRP